MGKMVEKVETRKSILDDFCGDTSLNEEINDTVKRKSNNNQRNTTFTALGMTGSGKTCYIIGMHYVMATGIAGWTLKPGDNITADKLNKWVKMLDKSTGVSRFPAGTDQGKSDNYSFGLHFLNEQVMDFSWIDYAGALFEETSSVGFSDVEESISESTALYVFIDGMELCTDDKKKRFKNIRNHCARYIQPCITDFVNNYKDYIPPVIFVVTKSDLCRNYTDSNEICDILKESFSSLFYDKRAEVYISAVTLGDDISDDEYNGEVEPVNVDIPFFIGIHHELLRRYNNGIPKKDEDKQLYRKMISNIVDALYKKKGDFLIVNGDHTGGHVSEFTPEEWRAF